MLLHVRDLAVSLPGGAPVVAGAGVELAAGEVLCLLGPSGAGKSTLVRAMLDPDSLRARGFAVTFGERALGAEAAFVPQRGALLDHLDVGDNVALAQAAAGVPRDPERWLAAVGLDPALAARPVTSLSGGQAQRVALARALAAGRKLLVLDEPSTGLDPLAVRQLAALLAAQAREHGVAILVITHDLVLAADAGARVLFLDAGAQRLVPVAMKGEERGARLADLEEGVAALLQQSRAAAGGRSGRSLAARARAAARGLVAPLAVLGAGLVRALSPRLFGASLRVLRLGLVEGLLRPVIFYALVAVLLGITVPYVVVHISSALRPEAMLAMVGGSYVLALAPPVSAIVFSATSGSAINAWLGGLELGGQVVALEGLGVPAQRYLAAPAWLALALGYLGAAAVFYGGMVAGGYLLFEHYEVRDALAKLTSDLLDPAPERLPYRWRAIWLTVAYAAGVASLAVAGGRAPKERADDVTAAMTASVRRSTLLVALLELGSVALLYADEGR
jgi:ABC-type multidrug transport system ATPase subunit/ABC-type transporter Mla maintaining outer membrane lipid asymmetry permease subunit MlaE